MSDLENKKADGESTPAKSQLIGPDGLDERAFEAARKAYHQTHVGDYGTLRAAIAAYVRAISEAGGL